MKKKTVKTILDVLMTSALPVMTLISAFGVYAFITNRLYEYMLLQTQFVFFDFDKPLILVFGEYLSMIALFAWIGYRLKEVPKRFNKKNIIAQKADG